MRIAVIGSSGFVGKNLVERFRESWKKYDVYGISTKDSDTTRVTGDIRNKEIKNLLDNINPNIVIHSAKLRGGVDYYENHREEAEKVEIDGTRNLAEWAKKNNKKFILLSTDYVYEGKTNNYDEESETKPVNFYGEMKLKTEEIVKDNLENYVILRPTVIFGYVLGDTNFLMQVVLNTKERRKIPYDQISNPTDINVLMDYTEKFIERDIRGLFVATGPETINRYDFTMQIADVFNLDKSLFEPVRTKELGQIANRPLNNGTNSLKIRNYLNYKCPSLHESLIRIREVLE